MKIEDEKLISLLALWDKLRGNRAAPFRHEVGPENLLPWLGNLTLVEYNSEDDRYLVRLMGEHVATAFERDHTRKYIDEFIEPEKIQHLTKIIARVITEVAPYYQEINYIDESTVSGTIKRLYLPLYDRDGICNIALGALYFERKSYYPFNLASYLAALEKAEIYPAEI